MQNLIKQAQKFSTLSYLCQINTSVTNRLDRLCMIYS